MIDSRRWMSHTVFGLIGICLTVYVLRTVAGLAPHLHIEVWVFSAVAVVLALATLFYFLAAYAYRFGQLDEVRGNRASATLIRNGVMVRTGVRIWIANNADKGNAQLCPEQQTVLMIAGGIPCVCSLSAYQVHWPRSTVRR